jgi:hypothetical protein
MATTTNYGWTTPDDTALVKDGASAIRTLGSSVDTSVKALNPGTTAGDLDYYTAATTKARIAKGTAGQIFTMNAGATAPEWAAAPASGGMTLISTTTFNNTASTYTVSSIAATYKHLLIVGGGLQSAASAADGIAFRYNGDTGANYNQQGIKVSAGSVSSESGQNLTSLFASNMGTLAITTDSSDKFGGIALNIYNYAATEYKEQNFVGGSSQNGGSIRYITANGLWNNTAAITSITFFTTSTSNFKAGTVRIYGVS